MKYKIPFGGKWVEFDDEQLLRLSKEGKADKADALKQLHEDYVKNRLSFFLAHGQQKDFINDYVNTLCILTAPNQVGKTWAGLAWLLLRIIPCNAGWDCFTPEHGLVVPKWNGAVRAAMASYIMISHCRKNLWPKFAELCPEHELREYSPHWKPTNGKLRRKTINWSSGPGLELACGSQVDWYAYHQPPEAFEGSTYAKWLFDEQVPESIYDAAYTRGTTIDNFQSAICATPHVVAGRPDTGANGWVIKMTRGVYGKGLKWRHYKYAREDVPSAIISAEKQKTDYQRLIVEPALRKNRKAIAEGRSRWYGEPEASEGLVYGWDASIHWIDPFKIPNHWTRCRTFDPGTKDPFAGIWAAISPWQDVVLYREYYEVGRLPQENVLAIHAASGNTRQSAGHVEREQGVTVPFYEEVFTGEKYSFSVMDGRTFAQPSHDTSMTIGNLYARLGLRCIPASGKKSVDAIPIVNEYFEMQEGRHHILVRMGLVKQVIDRVTGQPLVGAPRLYVFNTLRSFRSEIESYVYEQESDKPIGKNDHLMTALKYLLLQNPRYLGDSLVQHQEFSNSRNSYSEKMSLYTT